MKLYLLGICGTFMAGIATLAKQLGHEVSGCDDNIYPPMSTYLQQQGIEIQQGYNAQAIAAAQPDQVIVGNVIKRGNPTIEYILNKRLSYLSAPQWLQQSVLHNRHVIAVAGTHGKTTTTAMIAWILQNNKNHMTPGFLIGGIPQNFDCSAQLGQSRYFVIEADEYDCAFFDKRSKFVHYRPQTCILNNLEFDHIDIFDSIDDIKKQFHYLLRTIASNGYIISNQESPYLDEVIAMGCWSKLTKFNSTEGWHTKLIHKDGSQFDIYFQQQHYGQLSWELLGQHNVSNALAAIAACQTLGIEPQQAITALTTFKSIQRRLELKAVVRGITIYDDFAHHPTAIASTLSGLRAKVGDAKIFAVVERASHTMRSDYHGDNIQQALKQANCVLIKDTQNTTANIVSQLSTQAQHGDYILIMSNRNFDNIFEKLSAALAPRPQ